MPIRVLPPEIANQIAAGEVVERPASAVKELIENSLDADGGDIRVEVRDGGRRLIRVQDDGAGIPAEEVALAFERHATSKIRSAEDLTHITTLGFRGEALASIAAVSHVTLASRTRDVDAGVTVRVVEGRPGEQSPAGMPTGTIVTVEHLFSNVPARLKFLKQPVTETAHIQQVITRYALAYPDRRFSFISDGRLLFQSTGSGKLHEVISKVYGVELARQMLPIGEPDEGSGAEARDRVVTGYTGVPALHRGNRSYITLFVNRRWFQDTSLSYAVVQAYHTMLPVGRYPVALVFVELDPADVDVNVHPTKAEVRFREPGAVFAAIQRAVRKVLVTNAPIPQVGAAGRAVISAWEQQAVPFSGLGTDGWNERRDALLHAGTGRHEDPGSQAQLDARHAPNEGHTWSPAGLPGSAGAPASTSTSVTSGLMPILRVVGQLGATYIVAEGPDGMYLIDQHAAHERVLYEQLLGQQASHMLPVQHLLEPVLIDLSPDQAAVVAENLEALNDLGLGLEPFGGASYLLRSIPPVLASKGDAAGALTEIVDGLAHQEDIVETTREARLITLICKQAAVKGNTPMTLTEMQELVRGLERCRSPRTCPHGRPTMIYMSGAELARQFGRT